MYMFNERMILTVLTVPLTDTSNADMVMSAYNDVNKICHVHD